MLEKSPLAERAIQYRSHNDTDTIRNEKTLIYYQMNYHNATFPAIPKSMVAVTTKLFLCQVLFYASLFDGFSQTVSMQRFIHVTLKSVTFRSANFPKVLVEHIVQWGKIHLCHNYLFLKYSFL